MTGVQTCALPISVDRFVATDVIEHNPRLPKDFAGRKQFVATVLAAFSDYHAELQDLMAEGDKVVARVRWTGTNDGPYDGRPPTHRKLSFSTADFFRIAGGKIAEHWDVVNVLPRMIALGQIQPPEDTTAKPR